MNTETSNTPENHRPSETYPVGVDSGKPPLVYNGSIIQQRDTMLSLTSMWVAAGSDPQQAPAQWRKLPATKGFVDHVELTVGKSHSDLFATKIGGKEPGTWAHWQVALAYAKYLSHDFHMWCNTVVRERMEGKPNEASIYGPREAFLAFRSYHGVAKLIGFDRNESALAANRATLKTVGIDVLATMGATHLIAETQDEVLTPTMIGKRLDLTAQAVNKRLESFGFQKAFEDSHGGKTWAPTERGKPFGRWFDTTKRHNDGSSVQQWKWFACIVEELQGGTPIVLLKPSD